MNEQPKLDRRKGVALREYLTPIITSVVVGFGSSYLAIYVAVNKMSLQLQYMERDIGGMQALKDNVSENKYKTISIEIYLADLNKRIEKIENKIN